MKYKLSRNISWLEIKYIDIIPSSMIFPNPLPIFFNLIHFVILSLLSSNSTSFLFPSVPWKNHPVWPPT